MKIKDIESRNTDLLDDLLNIWEESVATTHHFLNKEEIAKIKTFVPHALKTIPKLVIVEDDKQKPIGFMGVSGQKLEMLFISPKWFGRGIGRALLTYGIESFAINQLTVNEQNPAAKEFYQHLGFQTYKRTDFDEEGNPYPLLYMSLTD